MGVDYIDRTQGLQQVQKQVHTQEKEKNVLPIKAAQVSNCNNNRLQQRLRDNESTHSKMQHKWNAKWQFNKTSKYQEQSVDSKQNALVGRASDC